MNAEDIKKKLSETIASLQRENQTLKNEQEETVKNQEKRVDEIFREFLTIVDTFERAEQTILEKALISDDNAQKAVNRLLNAKKKALFVLEKYNVKKIVFENNHSDENLCVVTDTESNPSRQNGDIVEIEKDGYTRDGHLIRPAEVVIVRN